MPSVDREAQVRSQVCDVGRRLWERGLVGAREGNVSARLAPGVLVCTPGGVCKGDMRPEDLVLVDDEGRPLGEGRPSSEVKLHLRAYRRRLDCQAVVHAHPPVATAFSLAGQGLPDDVLPESAFVLGPVASVPFGFPGTDELPDRLDPFLDGHKTFLLSHHGAATLGRDVWDACDRMETLERVATMLLYANTLGRVVPMPPSAYAELKGTALHGRLA
ncbi:MAG: class II aldolase/adducin family protein [Armatimonadetes bacterium]|nr:class II aldolase/adducin family protein [Armatimonadota bacterium]